MFIRTLFYSILLSCFCIHTSICAADESQYQFFGRHMIGQYYDCDLEALQNIKLVKETMIEATNASGAQILSTTEHTFQPDGFTMVLLLSESHASIHTYPEHGSCFIDFFTCGHRCSAERFEMLLRKYLKPKRSFIEIKDRQ